MSRYKSYPAYKDSGVAWLGEIPPHWHSRQLKYLCSYNDEVLSETVGDDFEIEYVDIGSVSAIDGISGTETLLFGDAPSRARRIVRDGDILISTVRTYLEAIASVKAPPNNLIASTGFAVIRPNAFLHKGYAAYCLRASGFIKEVVARSVGVSYPAINASDLVNIKTPEPSPTEQEKIAAFLDHETAKIDALIEKQQRLIELLKEKRQAVISHAVTKGLNPNAPMKDSGVEWTDRVPAHWRVSKLGYHASVSNGATPNRENMLFWENGTIGWLNSSKVNDEVIKEADQFITGLALSQTSVKPVKNGDLVMAITGEGQTRGRVAICNIEATINQHLAAISIRDKLLQHEFLYLWLEGSYERIRYESEGAGSTKGAITCSEISAFPVILPPLEEQGQIVSHVVERKQKFDGLIREAVSAIELMRERRTALISAAVTGKIDVRDWQVAA